MGLNAQAMLSLPRRIGTAGQEDPDQHAGGLVVQHGVSPWSRQEAS